MVDYDDEIMKDDDWLYEEEKPKKKTSRVSPYAQEAPAEWMQKGCVIVEDEEAKKRLREELEKKEKKRQQNREAQKRWYEKKKAEKEAAKEREKTEQPKMTFADVAEELKQMEESDVDTSLERLAHLREMAEAKTTETENTTTEIESVTTEEPTEIVSEEVDPAPDQEEVVAEIAPAMAADITLVLTTSEAESLYESIKDELLTVVKRDDIEELDWLADMCSIYSGLRKALIRNG